MPAYYGNEIVDGNTLRLEGPRAFRLPLRLGERLIEKGLIDPERLSHALEMQTRETSHFSFLGEILIRLGYVPAREIGALLEEISGTPFVDLSTYPIDPAAARLIPEEMARQRLALPLRADADQVWVAMDDPLDRDTIHALQHHTGRCIVPLLALLTELMPRIHRAFADPEAAPPVERKVCPTCQQIIR